MYRVSVVTPSYNQAKYIETTILSVLKQSGISLEYIIMDGGSNDGSVEIIRKLASDPRIQWVSEQDSGPANAINKGWAKATGEYLCWINSDDYYVDSLAIESQIRYLEDNNLDLAYGDSLYVSMDGKEIQSLYGDEYSVEKLIMFAIPVQPTLIMRKSVYDTVGALNEKLSCVFDSEYWLRASSMGCKFGYNPRRIAAYRLHPQSITMSEDDAMYKEKLSLISQFEVDLKTARYLSARVALSEATMSLDRKKYRRAIHLYGESIRKSLHWHQVFWVANLFLTLIGMSQFVRKWWRQLRHNRNK